MRYPNPLCCGFGGSGIFQRSGKINDWGLVVSVVQPSSDSEIDFFELCRLLLDGKWLITACFLLAALLGFGYSQVVQPQYTASATYTINFFSVRANQVCGVNLRCMRKELRNRLVPLLGDGWRENKRGGVIHSTGSALNLEEYKAQIERASVALTQTAYVEAVNEIAFIQTKLTGALMSTEIVAKTILDAERIIQSKDSGQLAITFDPISVKKVSPKIPLILALFSVSGGIFGVLVVIVRNALKKRKERVATA